MDTLLRRSIACDAVGVRPTRNLATQLISASLSAINYKEMTTQDDLLNAFRIHYHTFEQRINSAVTGDTDSVVVARLGDDLDEYVKLLNEASDI